MGVEKDILKLARDMVAVKVFINKEETEKARQKFGDQIVVGRFGSSIPLFRVMDGEELRDVLRRGTFKGGEFSVPGEREYGAQWGSSLSGVVKWGEQQRGGRLGHEIFVAEVDGKNHQFAHLTGGDGKLDTTQDVVEVGKGFCNTGLGCSMFIPARMAVWYSVKNGKASRVTLKEAEEMSAGAGRKPRKMEFFMGANIRPTGSAFHTLKFLALKPEPYAIVDGKKEWSLEFRDMSQAAKMTTQRLGPAVFKEMCKKEDCAAERVWTLSKVKARTNAMAGPTDAYRGFAMIAGITIETAAPDLRADFSEEVVGKLDFISVWMPDKKRWNPIWSPGKKIRIGPKGMRLGRDILGFDTKAFSKKWEKEGLDVFIFKKSRTGEIELSQVIVPKESRGMGLGTKFMEDLVRKADSSGSTIVLTPDTTYGGSSVSRLKSFYKRFGFVENKGRKKDYSISATMYRRPKGKVASDRSAAMLDDHGVTDALVKKVSPTMKKIREMVEDDDREGIRRVEKRFKGRLIALSGIKMTPEEKEIFKDIEYDINFANVNEAFWSKQRYNFGYKLIRSRVNTELPSLMTDRDWKRDKSMLLRDIDRYDLSMRHEVTHALRDAVTGHIEEYGKNEEKMKEYARPRSHIEIEFEIDAIVNSFDRLRSRLGLLEWDKITPKGLKKKMPGLKLPDVGDPYLMVWVKRLMREGMLSEGMRREWRLSSKYRSETGKLRGITKFLKKSIDRRYGVNSKTGVYQAGDAIVGWVEAGQAKVEIVVSWKSNSKHIEFWAGGSSRLTRKMTKFPTVKTISKALDATEAGNGEDQVKAWWSGWQMERAASDWNKTEEPVTFWGDEGAGLLMTTGEKVLLLKRSSSVDQPGTWGIPGGAMDDGESPMQTAKRETKEETGRVPSLQVTGKTVFSKGSFKYTTFICRVGKEYTPSLDWENSDWAWVSEDELSSYRLHFGVRHTLGKSDVFDKAKIARRREAGSKLWLGVSDEIRSVSDLKATDIAGHKMIPNRDNPGSPHPSQHLFTSKPDLWEIPESLEYIYELRLRDDLLNTGGPSEAEEDLPDAADGGYAGILSRKGITKGPWVFQNMVAGIKLVDSRSGDGEETPTEDCYPNASALKWLKGFMSGRKKQTPSSGIIDSLSTCRPSGSVKVYRGMSWYGPGQPEFKPFSKAQKGSRVKHRYNKPSSWSTNKSVAEGFARAPGWNGGRWVVLEMTVSPDDVIVDTRSIPSKIRKGLYKINQRELIVKPGTYAAKVVKKDAGESPIIRQVASRVAATTPLPKSFPKSEPALMTKVEFLNFRNPDQKSHPEEAYDFSVEKMNVDNGLSTMGSRGGFWILKSKGGILIKKEKDVVGVIRGGTLYYSDPTMLKEIPASYMGKGREMTKLDIKKRKRVKYLAEELAKVSNMVKRNLGNYPHLGKTFKAGGEQLQVRFGASPKRDGGTPIAIINERGQIVAKAQDEWGATLLAVGRSYRGKGLGKLIGKIWYEWNPKYKSGGFTTGGEGNAIAIWEDAVREFLGMGWYSELIREGRVKKSRVMSIISEIGERSLPKPVERKVGKKGVLVYVDSPSFIVYDEAFLEEPDEKFIYGYGFFRSSGDKTFLYRIDYERQYQTLTESVAMQLAKDEGWKVYDGEGYSDMIEMDKVKGLAREGDYVWLERNLLPLGSLAKKERTVRKGSDPYGEKVSLLHEQAEAKW